MADSPVSVSGVVKEIEHDGVEAAGRAAMEDALSSGGKVYPCVVFRQGGRLNISTAFPFSFVARYVKPDSAVKGGDPRSATNRPMMADHVKVIHDYLIENKTGYILPPVTLNLRKVPQLHVNKSNAAIRSGFLVIPDEAVFYVTDGQHRIAALSGYDKVAGVLNDDPDMASDGLAVQIVVEPEMWRIHQDFADAAHTKAIPPSLLAAYNMREPVNQVLQRIVSGSAIFQGRVDETSKTLPKLSQNIFLLNHVRGLLKELLVGDSAMAEDAFSDRAAERLATNDQREAFVSQTLQLISTLEAHMEPWTKIKAIAKGTGAANTIPDLRQDYINLTATGLAIIGRTAYQINKDDDEARRLKLYKALATDINWLRSAPIWKGNIITADGKLVTSRAPLNSGVNAVLNALGIHIEKTRAAVA